MTGRTTECFKLVIAEGSGPQEETDLSFIGGLPRLPGGQAIPFCLGCGAEQAFFFQMAFPDRNPWQGLSLAVFQCVSCVYRDPEYSYPYFVPTPLEHGPDYPLDYLKNSQKSFRFLIFETAEGVIRTDYSPRVKFLRWSLEPTPDGQVWSNKIGGVPNWIRGDESALTENRRMPMFFLMQLLENFEFETVAGAPAQKYGARGEVWGEQTDYYSLFLGFQVYLFATHDRHAGVIYPLVQGS